MTEKWAYFFKHAEEMSEQDLLKRTSSIRFDRVA